MYNAVYFIFYIIIYMIMCASTWMYLFTASTF